MNSHTNHIAQLLIRQLEATITPAESAELEKWINASPRNREISKELLDDEKLKKGFGEFYSIKERVWVKLEEHIDKSKRVYRMWPKVAVAASIILAIGLGYFIISTKEKSKPVAKTQQQRFKNGISAGRDNAVLTLADGRQIILDSTLGSISKQGGVTVINMKGLLSYQQPADKDEPVVYNTISTPRGQQYQLALADGSKVWLNAASSVRFPTTFPGNERRIEITGEAYFEVTHDASKPFHVAVNGMDVEVLGTHFNINSYADENSVKTTLLEGLVKIKQGSYVSFLKPGQQAQAKPGAEIKLVSDADVERVMAWKNGLFDFEDDNLPDIMRQLSRWYDADIVYEGPMPQKSVTGQISRKVNVSDVLKMIELTGKVEFRIEDKKIFVKAK